MRAMIFTKWKLVLQGSVWRKEVLKTRGSEHHQKLTSLKAPPQKLFTRSWKTGSFKFVSNAVFITPNIAEE